MQAIPAKFEQQFFRALNSVVEPAVRRGIFSTRLVPTTLIVLESTGYISGEARRTPLFCQQFGRYVLISTGRGRRSFWVRNLQNQPDITYFLGGKAYKATATVIAPEDTESLEELPLLLQTVLKPLVRLTNRGWAFAILERD